MPVSNLSLRDRQRLNGIHPDLIQAIDELFGEQRKDGHPMFVTGDGGVRTVAQQQALYAKGRTVPGPDVSPTRPMGRKVTMKDGIKNKSNHQPHEDGFGHAVDCAFVGNEPFSNDHPWEEFGERVEAYTNASVRVKLVWGGRWAMRDLAHVELV